MKTAGIIGGLGPESTIEYYRMLVDSYRARSGGAYPPLIINSVDLARARAWAESERWVELLDYLVVEVDRLARAGADFVALSANTPHMVFDDLQGRVALPLLSIVEAAARAAAARGLTRVGLLGTRFTMQARFYPAVFERAGIALITPAPDEQEYVHGKYMGELLEGEVKAETRQGLLALVERMRSRDRIEGIVLGGTELTLILGEQDVPGLPLLDTTKIHVEAIVEEMLR